MATVRDLITDALYSFNGLSTAEPLNDTDADVYLRRLIRMLDTWANQNLLIHATQVGTITLVAGTTSYTTASLSTGRPVSIDSAYVRADGTDYPLLQVDEQTYNAIGEKDSQGLPRCFFYRPGYTAGTFYFYPTPDGADTVYVVARYQLIAGTITLDTSVSLPPGYEAAIVDNLAQNLCSSLGLQVPQEIALAARDGLAWLKRTNRTQKLLATYLPYAPGNRSSIIEDGA